MKITALRWFVKPRPRHIPFGGWGNGYVCLPPEHPCYGVDYFEIMDKYEIDVNGGLTFAHSSKDICWPEVPEGDWWIIGFDTSHAWDTAEMWPKSAVEDHTRLLAAQFLNLKTLIP